MARILHGQGCAPTAKARPRTASSADMEFWTTHLELRRKVEKLSLRAEKKAMLSSPVLSEHRATCAQASGAHEDCAHDVGSPLTPIRGSERFPALESGLPQSLRPLSVLPSKMSCHQVDMD